MRHWKAWALGLGALGLIGLFFQTGNNAVAQTSGPFDRSAAISGYVEFVDSLWSNETYGDKGYFTIDAPSGYRFDGFQFIGYNNGAAENIAVRPWYSATDSTSLMASGATAMTYYFASADMQVRPFPIKCYKLSVTGVTSLTDVRILGFCRRK